MRPPAHQAPALHAQLACALGGPGRGRAAQLPVGGLSRQLGRGPPHAASTGALSRATADSEGSAGNGGEAADTAPGEASAPDEGPDTGAAPVL